MAKLLVLSLVPTLGLVYGWGDCESRSFDTATQSLKASRYVSTYPLFGLLQYLSETALRFLNGSSNPCWYRCNELELSNAQALSGVNDPRFQSFLQALVANVNVRKLELESLQLDDAMIQAIVNALIDRSVDLYSLELTNQNFGDDGADAVAAFLAKTSSLRSLSLARNHIGDIGVVAIANALPPSLHEIDLSWNVIGDKGVEALLQAVTHGSMVGG
jgi:hypothetical protein